MKLANDVLHHFLLCCKRSSRRPLYLGLVGFPLGLPRQTPRHAVDLVLAAWHAVEDVDVEVLLDDVPDLVVLALLQVPLEQLVRVPGDAQHELAGPEVEERLVASHVLLLGQTRQHPQIIPIVTLLVSMESSRREAGSAKQRNLTTPSFSHRQTSKGTTQTM